MKRFTVAETKSVVVSSSLARILKSASKLSPVRFPIQLVKTNARFVCPTLIPLATIGE